MITQTSPSTKCELSGMKEEDIAAQASLFNLDRTIIRLINARGYTALQEIYQYIHPSLSALHSPFLFKEMKSAVERIRQAMDNGDRIGVFSDSDLDGITSLALLKDFFSRFNIECFYRYLKDNEQYGITRKIIDEFAKENVTLLITTDSGTRDTDEIAYARSIGIDVIITDHHEGNNLLPDAIILNPKLNNSGYPFSSLAGVGVAFKLTHALLLSFLPSYNKNFYIFSEEVDIIEIAHIRNGIVTRLSPLTPATLTDKISKIIKHDDDIIILNGSHQLHEKLNSVLNHTLISALDFLNSYIPARCTDLLDAAHYFTINSQVYSTIELLIIIFLEIQQAAPIKINKFISSVIGFVAIGTIADVMPLTDENRILVHYGLKALQKTEHIGLGLIINRDDVTTRHIGWEIAPLLNTPGRIGKTDLTAAFFTERDRGKILQLLDKIRLLNEERKKKITELYQIFIQNINYGKADLDDKFVFLKVHNIPEGHAGLLANRISDTIKKPVIVAVFPSGEEGIKASGRSRNRINFFSYIEPYSDVCERIGGHARAFGCTVKEERLDELMTDINRSMNENPPHEEIDMIDLELDIREATLSFIKKIQVMQPFGNENESPVFLSRNVSIATYKNFSGDHGKYTLIKNNKLEVIGWKMAEIMKTYFVQKKNIDITYQLEKSSYNGYEIPRAILIDIMESSEGMKQFI